MPVTPASSIMSDTLVAQGVRELENKAKTILRALLVKH